MPVRPRRERRHRIEWSPRVALALTIGPNPGDDSLDDAVLREAWSLYGPALMFTSRPGTRPWGWWAFDAAVPAPLRATRPGLYPVEAAARVKREREDLDNRRAAWLAEHNGASRRHEPHREVHENDEQH